MGPLQHGITTVQFTLHYITLHYSTVQYKGPTKALQHYITLQHGITTVQFSSSHMGPQQASSQGTYTILPNIAV